MQTNFKELKIWRMSFDLAVKMYEIVNSLPQCESRNIADQMRRTCTSIPLNIAEGASSQTPKQFLSHLRYAYASGAELSVLLMLSLKLKYIDQKVFDDRFGTLDALLRAIYRFSLDLEKKEGLKKLDFMVSA